MLNYIIESLKTIEGVKDVKLENGIIKVKTIYKRKNKERITNMLNDYFIYSDFFCNDEIFGAEIIPI